MAASPDRLYPLLFLSGLHLAFRYYTAARSGDEFLTKRLPAHYLDDGLTNAAEAAFTTLIRHARLRKTGELLAMFEFTRPFPKWIAIVFAFDNVFQDCPLTFAQWLSHGDLEANRMRLSCAMGIQALLQRAGNGFIHEMMREKKFGLDADEFAALQAFTLTRENALPEL